LKVNYKMNVQTPIKLPHGKKIVLASKSPRRAALLKQIGFEFSILASDIDENGEEYSIPEVHVLDLAHKKAEKVAETINDGIIIGADTIVVVNDKILGKPENAVQAAQMLRELSGETHIVFTGFSILEKPSGKYVNEYVRTRVSFRDLSEDEINAYLETESPYDKAGAYGIQDFSAIFVDKIDGCYFNVMGFPISKFYESIKQFVKNLYKS